MTLKFSILLWVATAALLLIPARYIQDVPLAGGHRLQVVELAITSQEKTQGLQGRDSLSDSCGMAFFSLPPRPQVFWMKGTRIPLDIVFLDLEGVVLEIHTMAVEPPRGRQESLRDYERRLRQYPCQRPVFCALEIRAGLSSELGLRVGDRVMALSWQGLQRQHPEVLSELEKVAARP